MTKKQDKILADQVKILEQQKAKLMAEEAIIKTRKKDQENMKMIADQVRLQDQHKAKLIAEEAIIKTRKEEQLQAQKVAEQVRIVDQQKAKLMAEEAIIKTRKQYDVRRENEILLTREQERKKAILMAEEAVKKYKEADKKNALILAEEAMKKARKLEFDKFKKIEEEDIRKVRLQEKQKCTSFIQEEDVRRRRREEIAKPNIPQPIIDASKPKSFFDVIKGIFVSEEEERKKIQKQKLPIKQPQTQTQTQPQPKDAKLISNIKHNIEQKKEAVEKIKQKEKEIKMQEEIDGNCFKTKHLENEKRTAKVAAKIADENIQKVVSQLKNPTIDIIDMVQQSKTNEPYKNMERTKNISEIVPVSKQQSNIQSQIVADEDFLRPRATKFEVDKLREYENKIIGETSKLENESCRDKVEISIQGPVIKNGDMNLSPVYDNKKFMNQKPKEENLLNYFLL